MTERRVLVLLLTLQLIRGGLWAMLVPLWQNPDEHHHYEYAKLVAERGRIRLDLPLKGSTAYRVLVALGHADPPAEEGATHSGLRREITASLQRHGFWEIRRALPRDLFEDTELYQPPLAYLLGGEMLRLMRFGGVDREAYALRFFNVVLTVALVGLAYRVARQVWPERPHLAVAVAAFVTFLPQFTSLAGSITNDSVVNLAFTGVFLGLVRVVRGGWTPRRGLGVAASIVVAMLTKKTALFLGPILLSAWDVHRAARRGVSWPRYVAVRVLLLAVLAVAFLTAPRWTVPLRHAVDAGGWAAPLSGLGATVDRAFRGYADMSLADAVLWRAQVAHLAVPHVPRYFAVLFYGFWGNFGYMEARLSATLYLVLAAAVAAAVVGLVLLCAAVARRRVDLAGWQQETLVVFAASVLWVVALAFTRDALMQGYSQGRNLYPVLVPIAVLLVAGWGHLARGLGDRRLARAVVVGMASLDAISVLHYAIPFFYGVTLFGVL